MCEVDGDRDVVHIAYVWNQFQCTKHVVRQILRTREEEKMCLSENCHALVAWKIRRKEKHMTIGLVYV